MSNGLFVSSELRLVFLLYCLNRMSSYLPTLLLSLSPVLRHHREICCGDRNDNSCVKLNESALEKKAALSRYFGGIRYLQTAVVSKLSRVGQPVENQKIK